MSPYPTSKLATPRGFNLVELCVAIALLGTCFTILMGLLSGSIGMLNNGLRQGEASRILMQLATGLRAAQPDEEGEYRLTALGTLGDIRWRAGGSPPPAYSGFLTAEGSPVSEPSKAAVVYRVEITPPADAWSSGRALLRLAWPSTTLWEDDGWVRQSGDTTALVILRP